jgi:hypothetical protein
MANKAKKANWENHIRQLFYLEQGLIMIPKKNIRAKSKHKQLVAANMMVKAKNATRRQKRMVKEATA